MDRYDVFRGCLGACGGESFITQSQAALDKRVASLSSGAPHNKLDTIIPYRSMASKCCDKEINMPVRNAIQGPVTD